MITYDNLWKTLKKKGITQYRLIHKYHISPGQITRLKRNESVSTNTIDMFCSILDCQVSDIMEYHTDEQPCLFLSWLESIGKNKFEVQGFLIIVH